MNKWHIITFSFFIIVFLIFRCEDELNERRIINLDMNNHKLYEKCNINIESIIKLEDNENSIIGQINRLELFFNRIYVFDRDYSKSLFVFNSEGEYISKTPSGRGPGEMIDPSDFYLNRIDETIIIFDQRTFRLLTFDKDLNFISSKDLNTIAIRNFTYVGNDTVLVLARSQDLTKSGDPARMPYYDYLIYTNNYTKVIDRFRIIPENLATVSLSSPICFDNGIKFLSTYDDNIYTYDDGKIQSEYFVDRGKLGFTEDEIVRGIDRVNEIRKGNKISSLDDLHETDEYISFSFYTNKGIQFYIYSKELEIGFYSEILFNSGLLPKSNIKAIQNGKFISVIEVNEMETLSTQFKNSINQDSVYLEGNPYLIKFSFDLIK